MPILNQKAASGGGSVPDSSLFALPRVAGLIADVIATPGNIEWDIPGAVISGSDLSLNADKVTFQVATTGVYAVQPYITLACQPAVATDLSVQLQTFINGTTVGATSDLNNAAFETSIILFQPKNTSQFDVDVESNGTLRLVAGDRFSIFVSGTLIGVGGTAPVTANSQILIRRVA